MKDIETFIEENKIRISSNQVDYNPQNPSWSNADHWSCALRRIVNGKYKRMSCYFSKGFGHEGKKPTVEEVVSCLASDAQSSDMNLNEFFHELCYENIFEAEQAYNSCKNLATRLMSFLGCTLYKELIYQVEPY